MIDPFIDGGYRWGLGGLGAPVTITYSFPQNGATWIGDYYDGEPFDGFQAFNASQQEAARQALASWQDVANITFVETADTPTDVGDIRFGFSNVVTNDSFAVAWGYFPYSNPGYEFPEAGDIWFDPAYQPNLQMAPGQFGFSTLIHEIGHALGLDHPFDDGFGEPVLPASLDNNQYTIMAYDRHPYTLLEASSPLLLDILAIQYIYGANMNTRTGNDVYTFNPNTPVVKAIWDAGGIDTIDCSNFTWGVTIDLSPGAFSSIYTTYDVAIAYGAVIENATGSSNPDNLFGSEIANVLIGNGGNDQILAYGGNDNLQGGSGNDILDGGAGDDTLDGGIGTDLLRGGVGNDIYVLFTAGDTIDEEGNKDTADQVFSAVAVNLATLGKGAIENAALISNANLSMTGNASANVLIGGEGNNTINGAGGDDVLAGQGGNDTLTDTLGNNIIYGGTGNDVITAGNGNDILLGEAGIDTLNGGGGNDQLYGGDGADKLNGGAGNDLLLGGLGADVMVGGTGSDIYFVDDIKDTVTETGTDLNDEVRTVFSVNLTTQFGGLIEHAIIEGTALSITGNARDNRMTGNALSNTLIGLGGNDVLDGGGGDDILKGGAGADAYIIDSLGDVIDEEGNKDINDIVIGAFSFDLATFAGGVIENAILLGTVDLTATGTAIANGLVGNAGANVLDGGGGDDTIIGGDGNDTLLGGQGNDSLDGGTGDDVLKGGAGNDTYFVDSPTDVVDEEGNTDVNDSVFSSASFKLANGIEFATLTGSMNADLIGNAAANILNGNSGANTLDGASGADILRGGAGNDLYIIDDVMDVVDEQGNLDVADGVQSSTLSLNLSVVGGGAIEHAILMGGGNLNITGNDAANVLYGNDGSNLIDGKLGNDFISAGKGNDTLIGGGGQDSLYGEDGDDLLYTSAAEGNVISGGTGFDIWSATDSTGLHDLLALNVVAVEQIDINGAGVNGYLIDRNAVMTTSSSDTLILTGGADDWALLSSDFSFAGLQSLNSSTYRSYVSNGVTLLLGENVQVGGQALTSIDLDSLNGENGFTILGATKDSYFGASVSAAKDFNGDGYDDIIGGAPATLSSLSRSGDAFVIYGAANGFATTIDTAALDGSDGFKLSGTTNGSGFGSAVASAGDIDGDGLLDLVVGASTTTVPGLQSAGTSHVLLGSDSAFPAVVPSTSFNGSDGFSLTGKSLSEMSGYDIAGVGDMNGDGFDDLVIGAPEDASSGLYAGSAYVYYGHADPFAATASLSTLNGTKGFSLDGKAGSYLGGSVSGIGDFNGDGLSDIIVGAEQTSAAYIVFGSRSGMPASISPTTLNGSNGFSVIDNLGYLRVGHAVSSAGDLNGDGYDDLIITNPFDPRGGSQSGAAYVLFGHAGAQPASVNISSLNGTNGFTILGPEFSRLGADVTCVGDVNGDGYDDIVISSFDYRMGGDTVAYLIFGHGGSYSATMDIDALTPTTGIEIHLVAGNVVSAPTPDVSVSGLGDVNGDGFDDFAIGDRNDTVDGETSSGRSHVVFGDELLGQVLVTMGSAGDNVLNGQGAADNITGAQGNDIIHGNGGADVLNGGQGNDEIHVADNKFFRIDGGTGVDALHLDYSGAIDFGNLDGNVATSDRGRIENVEVIDVVNGLANALTLHLADLLDIDANISNVGGVASLDNALRIDGESGDTLRLFASDGWSAADSVTLAGYTIYTHQAVKVAVDTDIVVSVA